MSELLVQVVVVAKDNLATTVESVDSLIAATPGLSLIAIDNDSKDPGVWEYLSIKSEIAVRNNKQVSLAQAWNQGVYLSTAPSVVITNNDILYSPGWLPPIVDGLADSTIGILQSYNTLSGRPVGFPTNYKPVNRIGDIPADNFVGCCFGMRREVFDRVEQLQTAAVGMKVGGFDSRLYPFGAEDQDFLLFVRRLGLKIQTHFGSYIHHFTGRTMEMLYTPSQFHEHQDRCTEMVHAKHSGRKKGDKI